MARRSTDCDPGARPDRDRAQEGAGAEDQEIKKAQAEGKDLGKAQDFFNEGDKLLKDGMQDEATEAFKKARDAMPKN